MAALLSYFWFDEVMTPKKWLGLLIGFGAFLPEVLQVGPLGAHLWPRLLPLIAVISSAYGWVLLRALMKKGYSPLVANGVGMFFGGLIALGTSFVGGNSIENRTAAKAEVTLESKSELQQNRRSARKRISSRELDGKVFGIVASEEEPPIDGIRPAGIMPDPEPYPNPFKPNSGHTHVTFVNNISWDVILLILSRDFYKFPDVHL